MAVRLHNNRCFDGKTTKHHGNRYYHHRRCYKCVAQLRQGAHNSSRGGRDIDVVIKSPIACRCVRLALQDYKQNHLKNERIYRQRVGQNH